MSGFGDPFIDHLQCSAGSALGAAASASTSGRVSPLAGGTPASAVSLASAGIVWCGSVCGGVLLLYCRLHSGALALLRGSREAVLEAKAPLEL